MRGETGSLRVSAVSACGERRVPVLRDEFEFVSRGELVLPASATRVSALVSMCPAAAVIGLFCFLFVETVVCSWHESDLLAADRTSPGSDFLLPSENRMEPLFDPKTPRNITIASGKTAYLPCRVRHLGERTVSSEDIDFVDARITVDADLRDAVHQIHAPPALLSLALHNERAPRSVCLSFPAAYFMSSSYVLLSA